LVKQACQRQLSDLARAEANDPDFPYIFDAHAASRICVFTERLPHIEGSWDTKLLVLQPWQCFVLTTIFGWVHRDTGLRRYRKALIVIPARNGKSVLCSAVALYMLCADHENGPQVYSAATTRDQAKVVWQIGKRMVERLPQLREKYGVQALAHAIVIDHNSATFRPLSRDVNSMEGLNAHCVIIDELAAHKTREVFDTLGKRTGSRKQPLTFIISTEGDNAVGVFAEQVDYAKDILGGVHRDDSYFGIIYTLDKGTDWTSPEAWESANPNYGVSVFPHVMLDHYNQAQRNPAAQASFLTRCLNVRVGAGEAFLNMMAWKNKCLDEKLTLSQFEEEPCIIALDLATKNDIAAKIYLFPQGRSFTVFGKFYCPDERLRKESGNPNYDVYNGWVKGEAMTATPGNVIDFEQIEADLVEDCQRFRVREVAFDPWQATELSTRLQKEGVRMVEVPMQVRHLSEPMKALDALVSAGRIKHNGDPVLTWMMGNRMAKMDAKENVYPRKARNENKIDGAVATIMALSRSIVDVPRESVYETRGVMVI